MLPLFIWQDVSSALWNISSLLRPPEQVPLKRDVPFAPKCRFPRTLALPSQSLLNFKGHPRQPWEVLSCRIAVHLYPPQGDPAKEGRPASVAWHFPWPLWRNSWAVIEGYLGIPTGLTGAHILNRADAKFIQPWNALPSQEPKRSFGCRSINLAGPKHPKWVSVPWEHKNAMAFFCDMLVNKEWEVGPGCGLTGFRRLRSFKMGSALITCWDFVICMCHMFKRKKNQDLRTFRKLYH